MQKKRFRHMTFKEKLAHLCGYDIWTEKELATWSQEDVDFYTLRIDSVAATLSISITGGLLCTLFCGFAVWAGIVL